jgi:hypothetical protein
MGINVQPTNFYTSDGQNTLVVHNGDVGTTGKYQGRDGSVFDTAIPASAMHHGDGKVTYAGGITLTGKPLRNQHF